MKIFSLSNVLTLSAVASAALAAPQDLGRVRRDVSELSAMDLTPATEYLPIMVANDATELPEGTVRSEQGYEYRTVRRLKLRHRNRRDVSHLQQQPAHHYLPPSKAYLPPSQAATAAPIDDTEEVVSAVEPKVAREYLPPVEEPATVTEAPVVETEAPVAMEEEQPLQQQPDEEQADVRIADVPTTELKADGYHYKQPAEVPVELKEAAREYLPPLSDDTVAEGPANGESSVLTKDGYQYRSIRRYRF